MLPAIALIAFMAAVAGPTDAINVSAETLIPVPSGAFYIGEDIDCTADRATMLRYGDDKSLSICRAGKWELLTIEGTAR